MSTLTQCYKSQINDLETRLQKETEELKKQLTLANEATSNINMRVQDNLNRNIGQYALPVLQGKEDGSDGEMDINVTMLPREEGEVMCSTNISCYGVKRKDRKTTEFNRNNRPFCHLPCH